MENDSGVDFLNSSLEERLSKLYQDKESHLVQIKNIQILIDMLEKQNNKVD